MKFVLQSFIKVRYLLLKQKLLNSKFNTAITMNAKQRKLVEVYCYNLFQFYGNKQKQLPFSWELFQKLVKLLQVRILVLLLYLQKLMDLMKLVSYIRMKIRLKYLQYTTVFDYCVTYACHQDNYKWEVKADACLCYDTSALKIIDSTIPKEMKRYK